MGRWSSTPLVPVIAISGHATGALGKTIRYHQSLPHYFACKITVNAVRDGKFPGASTSAAMTDQSISRRLRLQARGPSIRNFLLLVVRRQRQHRLLHGTCRATGAAEAEDRRISSRERRDWIKVHLTSVASRRVPAPPHDPERIDLRLRPAEHS